MIVWAKLLSTYSRLSTHTPDWEQMQIRALCHRHDYLNISDGNLLLQHLFRSLYNENYEAPCRWVRALFVRIRSHGFSLWNMYVPSTEMWFRCNFFRLFISACLAPQNEVELTKFSFFSISSWKTLLWHPESVEAWWCAHSFLLFTLQTCGLFFTEINIRRLDILCPRYIKKIIFLFEAIVRETIIKVKR